MSRTKRETGERGEQMAIDHLLAMGYRIIERNYRIGHLEIDIIAQHDNTIHIIEVKTRQQSHVTQFSPQAALNHTKLERITRAAEQYITLEESAECNYTIDLITIIATEYGEWQLSHYHDVQWL